MTSQDQGVRKLDLAARAIDLTLALGNATKSNNSLIKGAWEIGQWLGREKLNQYELEDCMKKAKGLVFPNRNCEQLFNDIVDGVESKPVGPLFLQQSGSLGRLMASDPNLNWMVSTVTCLFQFHRNDLFVAEVLSALIVRADSSKPTDGSGDITYNLIYNHAQIQIRRVIQKIVSSVWYNVVNSGCDTIPLPPELMGLCAKGHYLDPGDFSIVAHTIHTKCKTKAILKTDRLLRNITLWLLLHYDGLLVVNVGGNIVYEADFGNSEKELEIHVKSICAEEDGCEKHMTEKYEIFTHVAGNFEYFLSGYSFRSFESPQPGIRQKLYEVPQLHPKRSALWDTGIQILVKCTAQEMMRWILSIPVVPQRGFSELGFTALLSPNAGIDSKLKVGNILKRVPAMINLDWGQVPPAPVVYSSIRTVERLHPHYSDPTGASRLAQTETEDQIPSTAHEKELDFAEILLEFPILVDRLKKIRNHCACNSCKDDPGATDTTLARGCLRRIAAEEIMLLLAHGIADGFNVNDASAILEPEPIIRSTVRVLSELHNRKFCWDSWFCLAAAVYLGCPFVNPVGSDHPAYGGTSIAAIQYGNLAAQAPWLDLSKKLDVRGCFGMIGVQGRLGVLTAGNDADELQFRGVEENFAIIETENTEDTSSFNSRFKKGFISPDSEWEPEADTSAVTSDVILVSVDDHFYRLLLRVKTSKHWRIIDPSDSMNGVIRINNTMNCPHQDKNQELASHQAKLYTFEELLGRWPDTVEDMMRPKAKDIGLGGWEGTIHLSRVLDSYFKQNVALALSVSTTVIQNRPSSCCWSCSLEQAKKLSRKPLREDEGGPHSDRYIVNIEPPLTELIPRRRQLVGAASMPSA